MRLRVHSYYDHFPDHNPVPGEPFIDCYVGDFCRFDQIMPNSIALMLEPRSIEHLGYEYVERYPENFKYIFTYDSKLLKLPNAKFWVWATVWCKADVEKTKGISLVASHKKCCELHEARTRLANEFDRNGMVDCFGTYKGNKSDYIEAYDAHARYKFAIAMENYIDDYWFTEKILNCFATKTVPIYLGARKINEFFDADGIIQVNDWHDIPEIVAHLDIDAEYAKRKIAIENNYKRALSLYGESWHDRFFKQYGDLLEDMVCTRQ